MPELLTPPAPPSRPAQAPSLPGRADWLVHGLAVLTVLLALPLVFLGADVTTKGVGMVDPVWPTSPLYLLENSWVDRGIGFLVEHGHRVFGYAVGIAAILLVAAVLRWERRSYVRRLALVGLLGICVQGLLGGFRVRQNSTELAMVHGIFGQMVVSVLAALAFATSPRWAWSDRVHDPAETRPLRQATALLTGLLLFQLVMGALIRHEGSRLGQRFHLLNAFVAVAALAWLVKVMAEVPGLARGLRSPRTLLIGLVVVQLSLGVEAWMLKYADLAPVLPSGWFLNRDLVRTLHVLVGALVLAASVVLTLEAHRRTAWSANTPSMAAVDGLEGAP